MKLYLACADEEINKKEQEVYDKNKKLIDDYTNLPFYKKFFKESPRNEILENWMYFEKWMKKRIIEKLRYRSKGCYCNGMD